MSLCKKIIYLIIAVIFMTAILSGCMVSFNLSFENKEIEINTTEEENMFYIDAEEIKKVVGDFIENLKSMEDQKEVEETLIEFKNSTNLIIDSIYFASETGEFYFNPFVELPENYDARTRIWYIQAMKDELYISEIYEDTITGKQIITIANKIDINSKLCGVVGIDVVIGEH